MEGSFLPPPAKRPYNNLSSTTMQETNKRRLKPTTTTIQPPIIIPPGHVSLRLLCHMSKIGGVIGKSGSVVKLFRQQTGAKIQIDELVSDCDEQVILIVALENPKKKISLKGVNDEESEQMYELSPAQEALLKVFERVLDVDAEIEGIFPPSSGVVTCRLLAFTTQIGSVMGKGGKIIEKIRKESGAKIRVLPVEQLPACASSNDEVIQLMGDVLAVKKALVSISHCLQVHPTLDKGQMMASSNQSYPDPRGEFPRTFPDPRAEHQHMFPDPRGEHPRMFPNPRGQYPQTFPDSRGERPQMFPNPRGQHPQTFPNPRGQHPQTFPDSRGERPQMFPDPRGEHPRTFPDPRGERSQAFPVPRGEHPRTFPDPRGEHPRTYPDPRGEYPRTYPDPRGEHPRTFSDSHRGSIQPPTVGSSVDYASRGRQLSKEVDRTSMLDPNMTQQEVLFKLLCSNEKVGGVIGKGGTIVKTLQNETGTSISVASPVDESDERVITISALENPESRFSPAQNAVVRVFSRSVEVGLEKGLDSGLNKGSSVSARILIPTSQIGCLMGKGGTIISEMRKATRTGIRIIGGDEVPKCASENEEVVQIVGEFGNVQDALFHVTGRLRDNLFPNRVPNGTGGRSYSSSTIPENNPYGRSREPNSPAMYPPVGQSQNHDRQATLTKSMDHLGLSHSSNHPPSPRPWVSQRPSGGNSSSRGIADIGGGLPSLRGGLELGSGSKSAIVTNTTVEIVVPEHVIGSVYGENGSNLSRLRQISGAKVTVHDPRPGTSEGMVIISGTPDQTQAAQSLLQAFIISGQ